MCATNLWGLASMWKTCNLGTTGIPTGDWTVDLWEISLVSGPSGQIIMIQNPEPWNRANIPLLNPCWGDYSWEMWEGMFTTYLAVCSYICIPCRFVNLARASIVYIWLIVCLIVSLLVCLLVCLLACLLACLFVWLFVCLFVCLLFRLPVCFDPFMQPAAIEKCSFLDLTVLPSGVNMI